MPSGRQGLNESWLPQRQCHTSPRRHRMQGFTYIAVLVALLLLGLASQGVMQYASHQAQREREAQLLTVGQAYVAAIGAYYESSPGTVKRWPQRLDDLLDDRRQVVLRRHLRELYPDPVTRGMRWELIRAPDGGIQGVYSSSELVPIRSSAIDLLQVSLPAAARYSDWRFQYTPANTPVQAVGVRS